MCFVKPTKVDADCFLSGKFEDFTCYKRFANKDLMLSPVTHAISVIPSCIRTKLL